MIGIRRTMGSCVFGALAFAGLAITGCATGGAWLAASDGGEADAATIGLAIEGVTSPPAVKALEPHPGRRFLALKVALGNASTESVSASFVQLSLTTDAALVLLPSVASPLTNAPCAVDTLVAPGGHFVCEVVFELPLGQHPSRLRYDDRLGHAGSADVPALGPPSACTLTECWSQARKDTGSDACTRCLQTTCGAESEAKDGACLLRCACAPPPETSPTAIASAQCACMGSCFTSEPCTGALRALTECELGCVKVCDHPKCPPP